MIAQITGTLISKTPSEVTLDCGSFGITCGISLSTFTKLPALGSSATLLTQLIVRENEISLIGFHDQEEKALYHFLVKVDGIGPKLALTILGSQSISQLISSIQNRDLEQLIKTPGIGKKTAEKLCFELSEKLGGISGLDGLRGASSENSWEDSIRDALVNLGYKDEVIRKSIVALLPLQPRPDLPEAIRQVLKGLRKET